MFMQPLFSSLISGWYTIEGLMLVIGKSIFPFMYHPKDEAVQGTTKRQIGISIPVPARFHPFQKIEISPL